MAIYIASVIWALFTVEIPGRLSGASGGNVIEALCIVTLSCVPAALCGSLVQRFMPGVTFSGRWIWLLPSFLFLWALLSFPEGRFMRELAELLYPEEQGEAWWAVMLLTYPTLGCLGYSLGIIFRARYEDKQSQRKTEEGA